MTRIHHLGLAELRDLVGRREVSRAEVARAFLDRCHEVEPRIHAFLHLREEVVADAEEADRRASDRPPGRQPSLDGLPLAVKDNICTRGAPTTCASRILEGYLPPYDATAWRRVREAGALLLGKTNLDEFAMGSSTEHSAFGPTLNPWDPERVPGGSSGGSAAVVAARAAPAALGSDTGGSVRQPAAMCGVIGLRPTYGRISRFGLVAFASSLDQIGPIARSAADCALVLDSVAGQDPHDSTTAAPDEAAPFTEQARMEPTPFRFGVPPEGLGEGVDAEVRSAVEESCGVLEDLGGERVPVSLPLTEHGVAVYYIVAPCEASSNLARFDGVRYGLRREGRDLLSTYMRTRAEGFGPEVKRRIMLGTYALSAGYYEAFYRRASQVRTLMRREYDRAFGTADVLVTPTAPSTAFRLGEHAGDPLAMYLSDAFTVPASLAGLPAISIPCGLDGRRLPIGLQLVGPAFSEGLLLRLSFHFLQARPFDAAPPE